MSLYYKSEDLEKLVNNLAEDIVHLPTIYIVTCKDCKRAKSWECPFYRAGYTYKADDYCSDGERKENGQRNER